MAAAVLGLMVAVAAPSSAAPDRTLTLSRETPSATWDGAISLGTRQFYSDFTDRALTCPEPSGVCDDTLIVARTAGTLSVQVKATGPLPYGDVYTIGVGLFRSDAAGKVGERVGRQTHSRGDSTITAANAPAGHYLVRVDYREGAGGYDGRASLAPRRR